MSVNMLLPPLLFLTVISRHLPDNGPRRDINTAAPNIFLLGDDDLREVAARIFVEFFPAFNFLADLVTKYISHEYSGLMKQKSNVITMPVLMKDEKKYANCVDVMDTLEDWIHDIYTKVKNLP